MQGKPASYLVLFIAYWISDLISSPMFSGIRERGISELSVKVSRMSVSPKVNSKLWKVTAQLS